MKNAFMNIARPNMPVSILLLMGCLAMWLPDFLMPTAGTGSLTISLPISYTFHFSIYLQLAATLAITLLNGLSISGLLLKFGIQRKWSIVPLLLYALFISACPAGRYALEAQLSVLLFTGILALTRTMFKDIWSVEQAYLATLLATVAAMFMPDMLWFIPVMWIAFMLERAFSLRVLLASLIGVCTVLVFWMAYLAWYHCFDLFADALAGMYRRTLPDLANDYLQPVYFLLLLFCGSFGIFSYYSNIYRESTSTRAIVAVTILCSFATIPLLAFPASNGMSVFPLLALWASIHGAYLCLSGQTVSRSVWFLFMLTVNIAAWLIL